MKLLIDTDWFAAIKDLQKSKQKEIMEAILDYPNKTSDTNLWKNVIEPTLERGKIKYFNSIKNLKQNKPQKSAKKFPESGTDSGTGSGIDINIYNNTKKDSLDYISTTRTRARAKGTIEQLINQTAKKMTKSPSAIPVTDNFLFPNNPYFNAYRQEFPEAIKKVETWIRGSKMVGQFVSPEKLGQIIQKFALNKK